MIYLFSILLVAANALEDGFRDSNKKVFAHLFNSLHIAGWMYMMIFSFTWIFVIQYILIRFALFDVVYNLIRKQKPFYIGSTSLYDRFWRWFGKWTKFPMNHVLFWFKLISFIIGVSLCWQLN